MAPGSVVAWHQVKDQASVSHREWYTSTGKRRRHLSDAFSSDFLDGGDATVTVSQQMATFLRRWWQEWAHVSQAQLPADLSRPPVRKPVTERVVR